MLNEGEGMRGGVTDVDARAQTSSIEVALFVAVEERWVIGTGGGAFRRRRWGHDANSRAQWVLRMEP
ncbi:unnamed protein product [Ilex paraguariensis]|uniref:Uncharacterized protein n=1 Tax=Ilex paraguariensis TaxID=185542 RepID=A0ABC8UIJ0_9AQUA